MGCIDQIFVLKQLIERNGKSCILRSRTWRRRMVWYVERKYEGMRVVLKITWLGVRVTYMTGVACVEFERGWVSILR